MRLTLCLLFVFVQLFFVACSSMDSDAKKAAQLTQKSIDSIKSNDPDEAERLFKESQDIISKYKDTEDYQAFYQAYRAYLMGNVNNNEIES